MRTHNVCLIGCMLKRVIKYVLKALAFIRGRIVTMVTFAELFSTVCFQMFINKIEHSHVTCLFAGLTVGAVKNMSRTHYTQIRDRTVTFFLLLKTITVLFIRVNLFFIILVGIKFSWTHLVMDNFWTNQTKQNKKEYFDRFLKTNPTVSFQCISFDDIGSDWGNPLWSRGLPIISYQYWYSVYHQKSPCKDVTDQCDEGPGIQ